MPAPRGRAFWRSRAGSSASLSPDVSSGLVDILYRPLRKQEGTPENASSCPPWGVTYHVTLRQAVTVYVGTKGYYAYAGIPHSGFYLS